METPRVILGTATFGGQANEEGSAAIFSDFVSNPKWSDLVRDKPMVDTAIMYQNGKTERMLGRILCSDHRDTSRVSLSTKANPFSKDKDLSPQGVRRQLETSLESLGRDGVDIFYLHAPDNRHPIEPTLEEVQKMFVEQKFRKFALSNFTAWETVYIHSYMSRRGYVEPTIYQGMYNAITRKVEPDLFPALRRLGMRFFGYQPLAAGMLTGKYTLPSEEENDDAKAAAAAKVGSRFAGNDRWGRAYRNRYHQKVQFGAVEILRAALEGEGSDIGMAEASLRWMRHHSALKGDDGIVIGVSSVAQYESNMTSLSRGPLPEPIVRAFDEAAQVSREVCPDYSRGYSGSLLLK